MNGSTPTSASSDTPTRVCLLAVGSRDAALLDLMLQRFLRVEFAVAPRALAEMAIVDCDASDGKEALRQWQLQRPHSPALVLSLQEIESAPLVYPIRKPINIHTLVDTLSEIRPLARRGDAASRLAPIQSATPAEPSSAKCSSQGPDSAPGTVEEAVTTDVVRVEICMSENLDEIFAASNISGTSLVSGPTETMPSSTAGRGGKRLYADILSRLNGSAPRTP